MSLPERLKKLRDEKGWTQKDLAREVDVHWNTVARWESEKRKKIGLDEAIELGRVFDVDPLYVRYDTDERSTFIQGLARIAKIPVSKLRDAESALLSLTESEAVDVLEILDTEDPEIIDGTNETNTAADQADKQDWTGLVRAIKDAKKAGLDPMVAAIEYQRRTFVAEVKAQREEYNRLIAEQNERHNQLIETMNAQIGKLADALNKLAERAPPAAELEPANKQV